MFKNKITPFFTVIIAICSSINIVAQEIPDGWHLLDNKEDGFPGISLDKAYDLLKDRTPQPVIIAVLDSGLDIEHEDLKNRVWKNVDEINGNNKDDDNNGFIDDTIGWNFIGNANGESLIAETLEMTRIYRGYLERFKTKDKYTITTEEKEDYIKFLSFKEKYEEARQTWQDRYDNNKGEAEFLETIVPPLQKAMKKDSFSRKDLEKFKPRTSKVEKTKATFLRVLDQNKGRLTAQGVIDRYTSSITRLEEVELRLNYNYSLDSDGRALIGEAIQGYGNPDVSKRSEHGTHVSGIIGAQSDNKIGIRGIASESIIMPIRNTPMGDESDVDVANGIRYAVDNGARVINMSFGKNYSPQKELVDAAVKYAQEKGVLLIHGAGNENTNIDYYYSFPSSLLLDGTVATNWIEVGATSGNYDENFVADFSNYGKKSVDVFAPGVDIYSTLPNNEYGNRSGTSMASPVVTGVAALLLSYFPEFTPEEVKSIIEDSALSIALKVHTPGTEDAVPFDTLSKTGKVVNAYEAVKLALERSKSK
ncbi:MAG: cell wall-associated protease [Dokdonia sp.]|jgi:cell wall-associated protease